MTEITDCFGYLYESIEEMCMAYNIKPTTYRYRIANGWDKDEALIIPVSTLSEDRTNMSCVKSLPNSKNPVYDHNNNMYSSIREMCAYYKINHSTYLCRRKRGWTQEEALTTPQTEYCIEDHKGNKFRNLTEMCNTYGLSKRTYTRRLELGYSKQAALETPRQCGKRVVADHLGNSYESQNAMLRHYEVSKSLFESRIRRGYSLEEALTCNHNERASSECKMLKLNGGKICDFNGKEFKSFREMCAYHHVDYSLFKSRFRDRGYTLKDALTPTRKNSC